MCQKVIYLKPNYFLYFSFCLYFIKSETSDSFVNHFDGHFAYLKTLDFYLCSFKLEQSPVSFSCCRCYGSCFRGVGCSVLLFLSLFFVVAVALLLLLLLFGFSFFFFFF